MKNITLSAKEDAIKHARKLAERKGTTLNELFRKWLDNLNSSAPNTKELELKELWARTSYVRAGRKFSREEMNER